jgi:hypothetical protein
VALSLGCMQDVRASPTAWHSIGPELCGQHRDVSCHGAWWCLQFVLDPLMQILKSFTVVDGNDMSLHYLKSKSRDPSTSENMISSTLPVDVCDISFLFSWSRVSPLVFPWVQNGDTKCQHVPQCPRNISPLALAVCMQSFRVLDITRHTPCRSHVHWQAQWALHVSIARTLIVIPYSGWFFFSLL